MAATVCHALHLDQKERPIIADQAEFEKRAAAFNRTVAASGRLDRIERWQIASEEGHA